MLPDQQFAITISVYVAYRCLQRSYWGHHVEVRQKAYHEFNSCDIEIN